MATMLPLACHAALKLWAEAVRMLKRAEDDLALFEAQYKEKVTYIVLYWGISSIMNRFVLFCRCVCVFI